MVMTNDGQPATGSARLRVTSKATIGQISARCSGAGAAAHLRRSAQATGWRASSALDSYLKWELLELSELLGAFDGPILWVSHELGGSGTPFRILRIIPDAGHAILLLQPEGAAEGSPVLRAECEAAGTYAAGQTLPVSFREEKLLFF